MFAHFYSPPFDCLICILFLQRPAVESAVTRLLVSIKFLLEALSLWSTQRMTETDVSDVYVRLGNAFNAAVAAFGQFGIEMTCVSIPLRTTTAIVSKN